MRFRVVLILGAVFCIASAWAEDSSRHGKATLISSVNTVSPGSSFLVGFRIKMDSGWHVYWKNPGDSGLPIQVTWRLPKGFVASPIQWPYPHEIGTPDVRSYGYEGEVVLITHVTAPKNLKLGFPIDLKASGKWLICSEGCLNASASPSLKLASGAKPRRNDKFAPSLESWLSRVPAKASGWDLSTSFSGGAYHFRATPPAGTAIDAPKTRFYPDAPSVIDHSAPQRFLFDRGALVVNLKKSDYSVKTAQHLKGVLVVTTSGGVKAFAIDTSVKLN